jgi:hypothetical protein
MVAGGVGTAVRAQQKLGERPACAVASSFMWRVTDVNTNVTSTKITTTANTDHTGFTPALSLGSGDTWSVSVTPTFPGVMLPANCDPVGTKDTAVPSSATMTPPAKTTTLSCAILLIIAIVLILAGGVVFIIGSCIDVFWVELVGLALTVIGFILFIIWAIVCAKMTACSLMITIECIFDWIVKLGWIVAIVLGIVFGTACGLGTLAAWGGWATIDSWLRTVMFRVGCTPVDCTKARG